MLILLGKQLKPLKTKLHKNRKKQLKAPEYTLVYIPIGRNLHYCHAGG